MKNWSIHSMGSVELTVTVLLNANCLTERHGTSDSRIRGRLSLSKYAFVDCVFAELVACEFEEIQCRFSCENSLSGCNDA